jgi:flagellar basal-body rod protein FlgC
MQAMEISRTALDVEWRRLELIAENLANATAAAAPGGAVYQSQQLLSGPKGEFASYLDAAERANGAIDIAKLVGVEVRGVEAAAAPPHLVHEPANPVADEKGMVAYPAIDHASEMTRMVQTARAYEANIVALNAAREMYSKALQLGERV